MSAAVPLANKLSRKPVLPAVFAEDFGLPPETGASEPEIISPGPQDAALAAARADAWAEGYLAGRAEAEGEAVRAAAAIAQALDQEWSETRRALRAHAEANAEAIAHLLMDSLACLFPVLSARHGPAEARAVVRVLLPGLSQEPDIALRAPPALVAALEEEVARAAPERDAAPNVRIVPDPALGPGDVRLRWSAGAASRNGAALWEAVASVLAPNGLLSAETREVCHAG